MRISLLLEREPFPQILEKTLSQFWSYHFEQDIRVRWQDGRPRRQQPGQTWLVNAYLNAMFVSDAQAAVFDPIKREFTRSLVWWKRPLQKTYVQAASAKTTARYLAQAHLLVSPAIPGAAEQMVVAGNHKIRWLNSREQVAYGIRKAGFHDQFMRQEIWARQQAESCGVPVPPLLAVDPVGDWFCEQYVSGTPVNRLADMQQAQLAVQQAINALAPLYAATQMEMTLGDYAAQLQPRLIALINAHQLLPEPEKTTFLTLVERLEALLVRRSLPWQLSLTHGDFQPANILLNQEGVWVIDWEYAAQRQIEYDRLVFTLEARHPAGLAQRLQAYVAKDFPAPFATDSDEDVRRHSAVLFMLEEMHLHLAQTSQPLFTNIGMGINQWLAECERWLTTMTEMALG